MNQRSRIYFKRAYICMQPVVLMMVLIHGLRASPTWLTFCAILDSGLKSSDVIFILVDTPSSGNETCYDHSNLGNVLLAIVRKCLIQEIRNIFFLTIWDICLEQTKSKGQTPCHRLYRDAWIYFKSCQTPYSRLRKHNYQVATISCAMSQDAVHFFKVRVLLFWLVITRSLLHKETLFRGKDFPTLFWLGKDRKLLEIAFKIFIKEFAKIGQRFAEWVLRGCLGPVFFWFELGHYQRLIEYSAEICKLSINCFVTMKIAFANTIGDIADATDGLDAFLRLNALLIFHNLILRQSE